MVNVQHTTKDSPSTKEGTSTQKKSERLLTTSSCTCCWLWREGDEGAVFSTNSYLTLAYLQKILMKMLERHFQLPAEHGCIVSVPITLTCTTIIRALGALLVYHHHLTIYHHDHLHHPSSIGVEP